MNSKITPLFASLGALVLLAGCASEPASHVVSAPPPASPMTTATAPQQVIITQQAAPPVVTTVAASGATTSYVVLQAPPAPQTAQAVPAQPSSAHVWLNGYWTWRNDRYEWMAGHWEVPPFTGAKWENPRVQSEAGAFRFFEGRWN